MKILKLTITGILTIALMVMTTQAGDKVQLEGAKVGEWTMDFDAAVKLAGEKNLPLILNFTGSDWCGWCKLMDESVFSKREWQKFAAVLRIPLIILFGAELWHIALYEALMFPIVQFHHANISLPSQVDRLLRIFIVTPHMHKVHHSRYLKETDSNYTSMLSIWDRVFGSFRLSKDPSTIQLGLKHFDDDNKQSVLGMLATPVGKNPPSPKADNSSSP